ncbi:unnamed protein product, partial [marine sediment metagenome]
IKNPIELLIAAFIILALLLICYATFEYLARRDKIKKILLFQVGY